jgi:hypothetical protein
VYGVFIEYLSQLPEEARDKLRHLIYDDNCHLARFALRKSLVNMNDTTSMFAKLKKNIDKFHFGNHVDTWCLENCNPYSDPELGTVNTVVCEQLFRDVNSHRNCKSMNESKYFLFWLYNLDLHNLDVEGFAGCAPDPRSDYRWDNFKIKEVDLTNLNKMDCVEDIEDAMDKVQLREEPEFSCSICGAGYAAKVYLEKHTSEKHMKEQNNVKPHVCKECDKILTSKRNLEKHILGIHRTCNICKEVFGSMEELVVHKRMQTTCILCGGFFTNKYGLERHMKTQH